MTDLDVQLGKLSRLPTDWDSYGGVPPTAAALAVLRQINFVPCSDGGVQLELRDVSGSELEVRLSPAGRVVGVCYDRDVQLQDPRIRVQEHDPTDTPERAAARNRADRNLTR